MQLIPHPFRWCGVAFWGAKHPVEVLMRYVSCESLWTDLRWRTSRDWRRTILKRCQSKWWKVWRLEVVLGPYTFLPQDSKIWQSILKISLNYPSAIMILHPSRPTLWSNIFSNHANIFQPTRMDQSDFARRCVSFDVSWNKALRCFVLLGLWIRLPRCRWLLCR